MKIRFTERLGFRLMMVCMACAFAVGVILSIGQIVIDARRQSADIDQTMSQILTMLKQPATEAAYNIDPSLAQRVVDGLARYQSVYRASVIVAPDEVLAQLQRAPETDRMRLFTDAIFGAQRSYVIPLQVEGYPRPVGELRAQVDTYPAGRAFLERAVVVILLGLLRAMVLALALLGIFFLLLTRPLLRLAETLSRVDPRAPQRMRLPKLSGHHNDELGIWIDSANSLLQSIEEHIAKREEAEAKVAYLDQFDRMTDLPNRTLFHDRLDQAVQRARREGRRAALLHADLSAFQSVNDQHGYEAGDRLLREAAARLRDTVADRGTIARLGGDQFGVLLGDIDRVESAADFAQSLLEALEAPFQVGGKQVKLELCIGIAVYPEDGLEPEALTKNVEQALGIAKLAGRNQYRFYLAEVSERLRARRGMQRELEQALARDQLSLHYQPQFDARTGELMAAEALLRWRHPERGNISPEVFIPLAEESGFINELGEWVVAQACRRGRKLLDSGVRSLRISVNVSPLQFRGRPIHRVIDRQLQETGLPAELLEVELTETAIMGDLGQAIEVLESIRALGAHVAIDDFGTGHSSLSYLRRMPIDRLKIDRSFIQDIGRDRGGAQIVNAIINLGHSLDLTVVAEGVETPRQLEYLRAHGCDLVQGFLLARPLPETEFVELVRRTPALEVPKLRLFGA